MGFRGLGFKPLQLLVLGFGVWGLGFLDLLLLEVGMPLDNFHFIHNESEQIRDILTVHNHQFWILSTASN